MSELTPVTPAQERFGRDVLAWGQPRPVAPPSLAADLRGRMEEAFAAVGEDLRLVAAGRRGRTVSVGRKVLERRVCDGWQLDPQPFEHNWAVVRASLARDVIATDLGSGRSDPAREVVAQVWHEAATRRPGDPRSLSAWLNRRSAEDAEALRAEVTALLDDVREVWPVLPASELLVRDVRRSAEVTFAGGLVTLYGVPDIVLDSRVRDDRARSLVIDLRTGAPRPERDREGLRFHALLVTLDRGRPPFRWASHHVAEGRTETEDLRVDVLYAVADEVVEVVRQLARLGPADQRPPSSDAAMSLAAGPWCADCRREDTCTVAAAARADRPA